MSGSGLLSHPVSVDPAAPSRYGGIVAITDELRSRHAHAVSVSCATRLAQFGVAQSLGHPAHADGATTGGGGGAAGAPPWSATVPAAPGEADVTGGADAG